MDSHPASLSALGAGAGPTPAKFYAFFTSKIGADRLNDRPFPPKKCRLRMPKIKRKEVRF